MAPRARTARGRAAKQAELDDEDEDSEESDDGSDDDSGDETPERPQELEDLLASFGSGAGLSAKVWRASLRPEDLNVPGVGEGYAGFISKGKVKAETLEDEIIKLGGGGAFKLDFYIDGAFAKGASRQININGPAIPKGQTAPPAAQTASAHALSEEAIEAKIRARLDAEQAKKREMADLLAAAVAPLAAKLNALEQRPTAAPAPSLADRYFEKTVIEGSDKPKTDPSVKALLDKFEKLEEREREREKDAAKAEKKALQEQIDALKAKLSEPAAKPATPQSSAAAMFAPIAEALAVTTLMNKVEGIATENDDEGLLDLLNEVKGPLFKQLKTFARGAMKGMAQSMIPQAPVPPADVPPVFADWARFFLESQNAGAKAGDVEWVRASLVLHRAQIAEAVTITNKGQLAEFALKHLTSPLNAIAAEQIRALDEKGESQALMLVGVLRETVKKADSTQAPQSVPVAEVVESDEEDDEDEDSEEDEDGEDE